MRVTCQGEAQYPGNVGLDLCQVRFDRDTGFREYVVHNNVGELSACTTKRYLGAKCSRRSGETQYPGNLESFPVRFDRDNRSKGKITNYLEKTVVTSKRACSTHSRLVRMILKVTTGRREKAVCSA